MDGGYTVTHQHFSVADIVPDSFRLFREFLPALLLDWKGLRLRFGKRFLDEARLKRRWRLDEVSPFETVRVLDPAPVPGMQLAVLADEKFLPVRERAAPGTRMARN